MGPNWVEIKTFLFIYLPGRPKQELKPLISLKEDNYGKTTREKLNLIREQMKSSNVNSTVITSLDEIAWVLNIRGFDIPFGTVFFAYAIITLDGLKLFTDLSRLESSGDGAIRRQLLDQEPKCEFHEYHEFYSYLENYVRNEIVPAGLKVYLSNSSNHFVHSLVPPELVHKDMSLVAKLKIIKNSSEIESARRIHVRDSVTLVELFYKLDKHFGPSNKKSQKSHDERN